MEGWDVVERAGELARRGEEFALATVVWRQGPSSGQQGSRAIVTASGQLYGWIGGACAEPVVVREAQRVISEGEPRLLLLGTAEQFGAAVPDGMRVIPISCQSEGAMEVYVEPVLPMPHLVIVGRSPMAHTLAEMSGALGWRTDLIDGADFSAAAVDARSIVVVATQGHGDEEAIEQAVAGYPAYLGLVASRRRGESVLGYLADRGVPPNLLERVQVPIGLDLGRTSHREIAVAILAELVRLRAAGALGPDQSGEQAERPSGRAGRRPGLRDDGTGRPVQPTVRARRGHLLLLQRRLPPRVREGSPCVRPRGGPMLIKTDFEVSESPDKVWKFFDDIPQVAACLPGAEMTEDLGDDTYRGKVAIRMGPVKMQFAGTATIKERDESAKRIVVDAAGAEEKGRGQAAMLVTAHLVPVGRGTKVEVVQDLTALRCRRPVRPRDDLRRHRRAHARLRREHAAADRRHRPRPVPGPGRCGRAGQRPRHRAPRDADGADPGLQALLRAVPAQPELRRTTHGAVVDRQRAVAAGRRARARRAAQPGARRPRAHPRGVGRHPRRRCGADRGAGRASPRCWRPTDQTIDEVAVGAVRYAGSVAKLLG